MISLKYLYVADAVSHVVDAMSHVVDAVAKLDKVQVFVMPRLLGSIMVV